MMALPWWVGMALVLAAVRPRIGGSLDGAGAGADADADGPSPARRRREAVAASLLAVAALVAVALAAGALRRALSVTPPTVRLAAGVAVGVVASTRLLAEARRDRSARLARSEMAVGVLDRLATGPLRVEVGVAVWALAGDHGTVAAVAASMLAGVIDVADGVRPPVPGGARGARSRAGRAVAAALRAAWSTLALVLAVLVAVDGILGL